MDSTANRLTSATTANGDSTNDFNLRILEIAPTAATVALAGAGAGNVDVGAHLVRVTYTTAAGSTQGGIASSAVTVVDKTTNGRVAISAIPTGSAFVTGRKVWMTAAGGSTYYLLSNGTIANNTATTLTANDSDATLLASTALSSSNTTGNSIIAYDGPTGNITIGAGSGTAIDGTTGAVDNAVIRADGTGGNTVQSSAVAIADTTGVISGTQGVTISGSTSGSVALAATATGGQLTVGTGPTTVTDSAGKVLSAALNTVQPAQGGTGITALGTGVATALAVNTGSAGAFVVFSGALGTPSSGTVTNLTGTASININGTVGATTPTTGAFTTVSATGAITPSQTNGIIGTTTNNDASAGSVGELLTASRAAASATSLTTITAKTITSVSLTAGDWDVWGIVDYVPAATTTTAYVQQGASQTDNALGAQDTFSACSGGNLSGTVLGSLIAENIPTQRISLAGTTTVYLVGLAAFAISTLTAYGSIFARRRR